MRSSSMPPAVVMMAETWSLHCGGSFFNVCTGTCSRDNAGGVGGHYCTGGMEWGVLREGRGYVEYLCILILGGSVSHYGFGRTMFEAPL